MPLVLKIESPEGQCNAVWEITETEESLLRNIVLTDDEKRVFSALNTGQRRYEWLAVRVLLKEVLEKSFQGLISEDCPEILYNENGKPYLKGVKYGLSISHSGPYAAIAIHPSASPGIDIECIHPRLKKIASRFINHNEESFLLEDVMLEQLCIIWCCKEALYKVHPAGFLSFKDNLIISPFNFPGTGYTMGSIITPANTSVHKLGYVKIHNYILAYT